MQNKACQWMLMLALPLAGCGQAESGAPLTAAAPATASMAASRQSAPGLRWMDPQALPVTADTAEAVLDPARLAQLSALPHLSNLNPREKAGLLLLLPPMSPSERLVLINMYPSLVRLPVQQKQILLDKLENIVPFATAQRAEAH